MEPQKSRDHVAFVRDAHGIQYEVVRVLGDVWWAPVANAIDIQTGYRCGLRRAPYAIVAEYRG